MTDSKEKIQTIVLIVESVNALGQSLLADTEISLDDVERYAFDLKKRAKMIEKVAAEMT